MKKYYFIIYFIKNSHATHYYDESLTSKLD